MVTQVLQDQALELRAFRRARREVCGAAEGVTPPLGAPLERVPQGRDASPLLRTQRRAPPFEMGPRRLPARKDQAWRDVLAVRELKVLAQLVGRQE
jgi:hypothetical protein